MAAYFEVSAQDRSRALLLDSGLLLLLFVGSQDPAWIAKFKRTSMFTEDDFDLLTSLACQFRKMVTTPYILTEVSNLLGQLPEVVKPWFYSVFSRAVTDVLDELFHGSKRVVNEDCFPKLGLTDAGVVEAAKDGCLVLTVDLPLVLRLQSVGAAVLNFNHVREQAWSPEP